MLSTPANQGSFSAAEEPQNLTGLSHNWFASAVTHMTSRLPVSDEAKPWTVSLIIFLIGVAYVNINTWFTWQKNTGVNEEREYSAEICFATLFLFLM